MNDAAPRTAASGFGDLAPPAGLVGGFLSGPLHGRREVVFAEPLFVAFHEADDRADLDREAYLSVYQYPRDEYATYVRRHGTPKGYAGPAACCRLLWDLDNADLDRATADTRALVRFVAGRYGEDGLGIHWSGRKGYHVSLVCPPGFVPTPHTPAVVKLLAVTAARAAGVTVDPTVYDRQRLLRLPNSRHGKSGLYKRFLDPEELFALSADRLRELARHPAGHPVPSCSELSPNLEADWLACERRVLDAAPSTGFGPAVRPGAPSSRPVVPLSVRSLIGLADIPPQGERAVRLFSAAAALAEAAAAHGTDALVFHLLEESGRKCGLTAAEVEKQIRDGIAHGRRTAGRGEA